MGLHEPGRVDYDLGVMTMSEGRVLFRIVRTNTPSPWDFTSNEGRGMFLRDPTPEARRLWSGVSVYDTLERARKLAARRPELGLFVAAVRIPDDAAIHVERTGNRAGHHTVWGDPGRLLAWVVDVEPV